MYEGAVLHKSPLDRHDEMGLCDQWADHPQVQPRTSRARRALESALSNTHCDDQVTCCLIAAPNPLDLGPRVGAPQASLKRDMSAEGNDGTGTAWDHQVPWALSMLINRGRGTPPYRRATESSAICCNGAGGHKREVRTPQPRSLYHGPTLRDRLQRRSRSRWVSARAGNLWRAAW